MDTLRRAAIFLSLSCLAALTGCDRSLWQSEFQPVIPGGTRLAAAPIPAATPITIREVPWERVQSTLTEISAELSASDTHYQDLPQDRKDVLKAKLVKGLQVSGDAASFDVLGRSEFRTTDTLRAEDGSLEKFAREIGATNVAWSRSYLGKADRVEQSPSTEFVDRDYYSPDGRRRSTGLEPVTVWRPIVVRADEYAWVAFYLHQR